MNSVHVTPHLHVRNVLAIVSVSLAMIISWSHVYTMHKNVMLQVALDKNLKFPECSYMLALSCSYPAEDRAEFPAECRKCV